MASSTAPKGRKFAKNKKKSWKNIDITEVEEFLESERLQERTGGLVAKKSDAELFTVDNKAEPARPKEKGSLKRKRVEPKTLRCYSHIGPDPRIKPARVPHNIRINPLAKKPRHVQEQILGGKKTLQLRKAEKDRKRTIQAKQENKKKSRLGQFTYSLWDTENRSDVDEFYETVTKKRRIKTPSYRYQKPSALPSVEVPHAGASYNPTADDWQNLLQKAHDVEVAKEKKEKQIYRALEGKFPTAKNAPTEKTWMEEMSAGLFGDEMAPQTVLHNDPDCLSVNPAVNREKAKTRKQHRKKHELKLEAVKTGHEKLERKRQLDVRHKLKQMKTEIDEKEQMEKQRALKKLQKEEESKYKTKRLGQIKFEDPDIEVKLSDELVGSLRELKPEGNLLEDRFKSLMKRNIIEPRVRARHRRKYKPKTFEKKGHREIQA